MDILFSETLDILFFGDAIFLHQGNSKSPFLAVSQQLQPNVLFVTLFEIYICTLLQRSKRTYFATS